MENEREKPSSDSDASSSTSGTSDELPREIACGIHRPVDPVPSFIHLNISRVKTDDMTSEAKEQRENEEIERQVVRLWRVWRTVHEMVADRVCADLLTS